MTMHNIATANITTNTNPVSFTNIPQNYTHLQIRYNARASFAGQSASMYIVFNNISGGSDYSYHQVAANGTGTLGRWSAANATAPVMISAIPAATGLANTFGAGIIDIFDYSSTTKRKMYKALIGQNQNATVQGLVGLAGGQPLTIAASTPITQIDVYFDGTAVNGSTFSLYGITSTDRAGA
jgi:hypothetical protein